MPACRPFHALFRHVVLWLTALAGALAAPALAAPHITPRLTAETPSPAAGSSVLVALEMTPERGWHGYWSNGGDAGFGLELDWTLPPGVTAAAPQYPVPRTLTIAGLMNHVYEAPYAVLIPVTIPAGMRAGTAVPLRATARWLACTDTICVPETADIALDVRVGDGAVPAERRAAFDRHRTALPLPLSEPAAFERRGGRLRLAIPLPAGVALPAPHLFVAAPGVVQPAAPQSFSRTGDSLIVELAARDATPATIDAVLSSDVRAEGVRGFAIRARAGPVPAAGTPIDSAATAAAGGDGATLRLFLLAFGGAVVGGLLLNLMPCVFPMLSLKALSLVRAGGDDARGARAEALAYTAGAVSVAVLLGGVLIALRAAGNAVGWAFQLQHPASILALFALALAITLNLAGRFELPVAAGSGPGGGSGARDGFATGALAAFVATPCSGPFLGAALGATLALPPLAALPVFGGLGLGLALPFVAVGFSDRVRRRLPRPGPWMVRFRHWLAVPMGLTALALVWLLWRQAGTAGVVAAAGVTLAIGALGMWAARRQRGGRASALPLALMPVAAIAGAVALGSLGTPMSLPDRAAGLIAAEPYDAARLAALRAAGRPVFVYFTADWCITCKANEAAAIERAETAAAFGRHRVAVLVGDWTNGDPAITRALAEQGRNSVPLYLWYAPAAAAPEVMPQILTPAMLAARAGGR